MSACPETRGIKVSRFRRPPVLRNVSAGQRSGERTSTWLELFFDLCFVVAVAALARGLHDAPTLAGALRFAGLFVPVWWAWMTFTWYATAYDNDDVPYRVALLGAMLCILWLAASIEGAFSGEVVGFVLAYVALRLLLTGLYLRAHLSASAAIKGFTGWYAAGNALGAGIWLSSLLVPGPARYGVWAVALFVELLAPILAVRTLDEARVSFHPRHIAERYGLFTIIVLGESVLAVAVGTADTDQAPAAVITGLFSFVAAACIWWLYFDYVESSGLELGPRPAFFWGYGHLAVFAAIAAFGVGAQLAIEGAGVAAESALASGPTVGEGGGLSLGARSILGGSAALYLVGISFIHWVNRHSLEDRVVFARIGLAALLALLALFGAPLPPLVFAAFVSLALLALAAFETVRADRAAS